MRDKFIKLDKDIVKALKELFIPENITMIYSSNYTEQILGFEINDEWLNKYSDFLTTDGWSDNYLVRLMDFIIRCNPINLDFIKNNELKSGDIKLLRSCYFYVDDCNRLTLNYKKPFGNSDIDNDILHAFNINSEIILNKLEVNCQKIFKKILDVLVKYLIEEEFEWFLEANYHYSDHELTENYKRIKVIEERKRKINILLS